MPSIFDVLASQLAAQNQANTLTTAYDQSQGKQVQPQGGGLLSRLLGIPDANPAQDQAPAVAGAPLQLQGATPAATAPASPPIMVPPQPATGGTLDRISAAYAPGLSASPVLPQPQPMAPGSLPSMAAIQGNAPSHGIGGLFGGLENKFNLPAGYLTQTAQIESGGDPNAVNKNSGAAGLFQFVPSTAKQYGLSDPTNVVQSSYAAAKLASDNADVLRNALGTDPTAGQLYLAHQQGAGGAAKLLANPDASAASIVGAKAVAQNGGTPGMTAGQFASLWTSRFDGSNAAPAGVPNGLVAGGGAVPALRGPGLPVAGGSPYGGLDPSAFGQQAGAPQLPTFAANGLVPPTQSTGFGPDGTGVGSQTGQAMAAMRANPGAYTMGRTASGQQQPVDADGNALNPDGTPTSMGYAPVSGVVTAPASRAIAAAAPVGADPLVAVPGYAGQWNKAKIAAAPDGTDVPDDGELAKAQGGMGGPPAPATSPGTAMAASRLAPIAQQPNSAASGAAPVAVGTPGTGTGPTAMGNAIRTLLSNPSTADMGMKLWEQSATQKDYGFMQLGDGTVVRTDSRTGAAIPVYQSAAKPMDVAPGHSLIVPGSSQPFYTAPSEDKDTDTPAIKDYTFYLRQAAASGQQAMPFDQWSTAKARAAASTTNISVGGAEKASEAAYGKAEGEEFGTILKAGVTARQTQGQLSLMNDAFDQSGGQIATGPFAKSILGAKQAIQGITGIDLGGIPESEAVQKLGFGLATNLTKEITARPAQAEFLKALENVPGIFMSPQGSKVMMSVLNQQAQQKIDLARLVSNPQNRQNWPDVEQGYYDQHPLISPFTGKPLSASDVSVMAGAARQAGNDPTTGRPLGATSSSGAPATPGAPAQPQSQQQYDALPRGTIYMGQDGRRRVKQ